MNDPRRTASGLLLALAACFGAGAARAQDDPKPTGEQMEEAAKAQELMRQIRRNLQKIEDDTQRLKVESAKTAGEEARRDMDKLVDGIRRRQGQVSKDIDRIIDSFKAGDSSSGSSSSSGKKSSSSEGKSSGDSQSSKHRGKPKDRNQSEAEKNGKKPRDGGGKKPQGKQPKPGEGEKDGKPGEGEEEDNSAKGGDAENRHGPKREDPKGRKVPIVDVREMWGRLPAEQRQKLIDRNFDDFTPEYEEEIREYLKRTNLR